MHISTNNKIVLIVNYRSDQQESMVRFGETIKRLLIDSGNNPRAWEPPRLIHRLSPFAPQMARKWLAYIDKFAIGIPCLLALRLFNPGAIWHITDHGNAIYAYFLPKDRVLVTCHDCIAIEDALFSRTGQKIGRLGPFFQRLISAGLRRSALIACVSNATAKDLFRLVKPDPQRVMVIPNGNLQNLEVPEATISTLLLSKHGIAMDQPFLFMIGSDLRRKNRKNVIECFNILRSNSGSPPFRLVFAGKPLQGENLAAANTSPWRHDILEIGNIDNSSLAAAYRNASAVLFPSLAEGFGLPIIEAQSCAAALVTSRRDPMAEIAGDGAILVNPEDPANIANGVTVAIEEGEAIRRRGQENAERYTPEMMLSGYMSAYQTLRPQAC